MCGDIPWAPPPPSCERGSAKCKHNITTWWNLFIWQLGQNHCFFPDGVSSCSSSGDFLLSSRWNCDHHIAIFKFLPSKNAPLNQQTRQLQLLFLEITLFNAPFLYILGCWKRYAPAPSDKSLSARGTSTRSRRLAVSQSRDAADSGCRDFSFPWWHLTEIKLLIPLLGAFLRPHLKTLHKTFISELNFRDWSQYRHRH